MKKKLRVAAIGLGWVTLNRHLPTMEDSPYYDIVGVIDRHPGKAREVAEKRKYPFSAETDDPGKIEWLDKVDAITVGVAPEAHYGVIRSALEHGKHVLTEKPFSMTVRDGEELVELSRKRGLKLGIVHNFQFASSTCRLMRDIENGRYGRIRSIIATQLSNPERRLPVWYESLPLGLFYDESPHLLYLISRVAGGELTFLGSDMFPSTCGKSTPAAISVKYCSGEKGPKGMPVTVNMNFEAPVSEWHLTVCGEKCLGDIDVFRNICVCLPNDGLHTTWKVFRTSLIGTWQHWAQHLPQGVGHLTGRLRYGNDVVFSKFAEAVLSGVEMDGINADDALRVLRMQHQVIDEMKVLG